MTKKPFKLLLVISMCMLLALPMFGCGDKEQEEADVSTEEQSEAAPEEQAAEKESTDKEVPKEEAVLYIGDELSGFKKYPANIEGEVTPDALIQAMSDVTGWNLTLSDTVTTGKGGMTVSFSKESALFVGPPEPQKEEFHVFDVTSLTRMILDSIEKTLQENFVQDPGDPSSLDIYYSMEGDQPLVLEDCGITIPLEEPYNWPE